MKPKTQAQPVTPATEQDKLAAYRDLQNALLEEYNALQKRCREIEAVLSHPMEGFASVLLPVQPRLQAGAGGLPQTPAPVANPKSVRQPMPLWRAALTVVAEKALTKPEMITAIRNLGYKFTTENPLNSLNVILYSNRKYFQKEGKGWRASKEGLKELKRAAKPPAAKPKA